MPESASPQDGNYLLHSLDVSPVCFYISSKRLTKAAGIEKDIYDYVRDHPGATISNIWVTLPDARQLSYSSVRDRVLNLVNTGMLKVVGQVPLETIDLRYERIPACDLCASPSIRHPVVFWKHNTPVVRCTNCGLYYSNPRWKAEHLFSYYGAEYWDEYKNKVRLTTLNVNINQRRWDPFLDCIEPARRTGRLLDVGCATGDFLLAAQMRGWETYGVEVAPISAEQAIKLTGSPVHIGTLDTSPYPDGMFDVVTLWDVLEHVQSPRSYVANAARLLSPGGMFALTTPNIRSIAYRLLGPDWWVIGPNGHIYYFAPRTLARLLKSEGFAIHLMITMNMGLDTWQRWLARAKLQRFSHWPFALTRRIVDRFLWGEELYAIGRLMK